MQVKLASILIHEADPQSQPVVITIFACVVCPSVRPFPLFKISQNKQLSSENSDLTGGTIGLSEWIVYIVYIGRRRITICLAYYISFLPPKPFLRPPIFLHAHVLYLFGH